MEVERLISRLHEENVEFLDVFAPTYDGRLLGATLDQSKIDRALRGDGLGTDFSSVPLSPIEDSDGYIMPVIDKVNIYPWLDQDPDNICPDKKSYKSAFGIGQFYKNGKIFEGDPRYLAQRFFSKLEKEEGVRFKFGIEAEFYLMKVLDKQPDGSYQISMADNCGYYDLASDPVMDYKKILMRGLRSVGIPPLKGHTEVGGGQHEIETTHADPITTADNFNTLRYMAKRLALKYGMVASFAPKVMEGIAGSGTHAHLSYEEFEDGKWVNKLYDGRDPKKISKIARKGEAGILHFARDIVVITDPSVNDHKRMVLHHEAPVYICSAFGNRSALLRYPDMKPFNEKNARVENRYPAAACNTYLAEMAIARAFHEGIKMDLPPVEMVKHNVYDYNEGIQSLPTLEEKKEILKTSVFVKKVLGPAYKGFVETFEKRHYGPYLDYCKQNGIDPSTTVVTPWEIENYVMRI